MVSCFQGGGGTSANYHHRRDQRSPSYIDLLHERDESERKRKERVADQEVTGHAEQKDGAIILGNPEESEDIREVLEDEPMIQFYGIADKLNQEDEDFVDLLNDNNHQEDN